MTDDDLDGLGPEGISIRNAILAELIPYAEQRARRARGVRGAVADATQEALERLTVALSGWAAVLDVLYTWPDRTLPPPGELLEEMDRAIRAFAERRRTSRDLAVGAEPTPSGPPSDDELVRLERAREHVERLAPLLASLNERDRRIVSWALLGATNTENAEHHGVTEGTVRRILAGLQR